MRSSWSGPRWWRRLPLAIQLASITVSVTVGWALLSRGLAQRRDARAATTVATTAVVGRLETQIAELESVVRTMQSALRGYVVTHDERVLAPYSVAERRRGVLEDSVAASIVRFQEAYVAFGDLRDAVARWERNAIDRGLALARGRVPPTDSRIRASIATGYTLMNTVDAAFATLRSALASQAGVQRELAAAHARDDARESLLVRIAVLASVLLLVVLIMRTVRDAAVDTVTVEASHREATMQAEMRSLRELEQLKTEFVSTVSHELRTPLTSIRGALGLVLGGKAGTVAEPVTPLLRIALQNTERLVRLINDILDIEKMASARFEVRRDAIDLYAVLDTTITGIEEFAREHGVTVRLSGETAAPIQGDSDRLVQLFTNLVSNAVKFSPKGETVDVRLQTDGSRATVSVVDRGPGIPEEFRSRIFGRFQQAEGTSGGTGLGLAIAQRIAQLHGGEVTFETAARRGTEFRVTLMLAPQPSAEYAVDDGRAHILLVDPDQSMLDVLATLAAPHGNAVTARTAVEALALARRSHTAVMILDPGLTGMDGFELVRRLRAMDAYHALPVLVFTASDYDAALYDDIGVPPAHVFVKSRHPETHVIRRLRAVLAAHGHE